MKFEKIAFTVLVVIHLAPVWGFQYFVTTDGPSHVYNATVLINYLHPDYTGFREYYELNYPLTTNFLSHMVLAGLMYLVSGIMAEKILISVYVILLPVSIRYALNALNKDAVFLSLLVFPFIYNHFLHQGFYNFAFSIPAFVFVIGYWLRNRHHFQICEILILAGLVLVVLVCHIVSLVPLAVTLFIIALSFVPMAIMSGFVTKNFGSNFFEILRTPQLISLLCLIPPLSLAAVFVLQQGSRGSYIGFSWKILLWPLYGLFALTNRPINLLASAMVVGLFFLIFGHAISRRITTRHWDPRDGFLVAVIALSLLYFIVPSDMSGGNAINFRIIIFPFLLLILWFGAQNYSKRAKLGIQTMSAVIALLLVTLNLPTYARLNENATEYLSGTNVIKPNSTIVSLCFATEGCGLRKSPGYLRTSPLSHLGEYISAEQHAVSLSNYEAETGYFPIVYRNQWKLSEYRRPWSRLADYGGQTRARVDYVVIWAAHEAERNDMDTSALFKWLSENYELIFSSPQHGMLEIYRIKV